MFVSKPHNLLVMRLRDPTEVLKTIPVAKPLLHKGAEFTVVPHKMPVFRLLRNMGLTPPHPVDTYYDWPISPASGYKPLAAQKETVRFLTSHSRAYCLSGMGTGKTISSLWAFDFLRSQGDARKLLVIAPLSTLERVWGDELFHHFRHLTVKVLHGSADKRRNLLAEPADVYIINHDGSKVIEDSLVSRQDLDTVIIDELSQVARNSGTKIWKALSKIIKGRERVWGMTGTPTPNEPTDAWGQARMITPSTVPPYFSHFRDQVMRQTSVFTWVPRDNANEIAFKALQPAIRFKRDDCVDLPPVTFETRQVALGRDQKAVYDSMLERLWAEYNGGEITAVNEAVKAMRLVQICCGAATSPDGSVVFIPPKERVQVLLDIIEESASKTIVFVPFKAALKSLHQEVSKHYTAEMIYGEVSKSDRDRILGDFQTQDHPQVLIAQPAAMSHGLTLTAASVIVWFAPVTSAETYEQANARITRPGQIHNQLIVNIQGSALEHRMYNRLRSKVSMQGALLEQFRNKTFNP